DKIGYNADAVFLMASDLSTSGVSLKVIAIDKSSILGPNPTFVSYVSTPPIVDFQWIIPSQMHGAQPGMPEYFVQDSGSFDAVSDHVSVVMMTNYLSASPTYVFTVIPVNPYKLLRAADQPTGPGTVDIGAASFTQADWRNGKLVTADPVG